MQVRTKQTIKIYWQHSARYPGRLFLMGISMLGAISAGVYVPILLKNFFDILGTGDRANPELINILVSIFVFMLVEWVFWRIATFVNNHVQPRVMADLLVTCFNYLHKHSFGFFNNSFAGSLVRKVNRFERSFEDITDIVYWETGHAALRLLAIIGIVFFRSPVLAVTIIIWCTLYVIFNYGFVKYKLKYDIARAEADTKVTGHLADTITNNINLKIFSGLRKESNVFTKLVEELYRLRLKGWNLAAINEAFQAGMMIVLQILLYYFAIRYWRQGILTLGDFALIQAYAIQIFNQLWHLGRQFRMMYERLADANEMTEILMTPHEVQDKPDAYALSIPHGRIVYDNVTFGYHQNKNVFENFNITIKPGERVAFIGPSGGGKTSLVKLLLRFMDIQSGKIMIDGQDTSQVTQESLRANLGLVPQEPILFHRSLYDNIAYANPVASADEIYNAAKLAHCHEFIMSLPDKYDTFVGERGIKLSGGERQRVAIARAILKNAPVLVLDEATSSLDSESESFIQDALKSLMKGKTTIVIAHRLSTIMQMDRIIVIQDGKILEEGRHEELLKVKQGTYQKLWEIQAGGFVGGN